MDKHYIPVAATCDMDAGTVDVFFVDKTRRKLYLRGGICWPMPVRAGDGGMTLEGYAVLVSQEIQGGEFYVIGEKSFISMDHVVDGGQAITHRGVGPWFNKAWAQLYARRFYYHDDEGTHKEWHLKVIRSPLIEPKPIFIYIDWDDPRKAQQNFWNLLATGKLKYRQGKGLHQQLQLLSTRETAELPAVLALQAAVNGMIRKPYRKERGAKL